MPACDQTSDQIQCTASCDKGLMINGIKVILLCHQKFANLNV